VKLSEIRLRPSSPALWGGLVLGILLWLGCFYNLTNYPTIWWDEAIFSETAANLVQHGRYAFTVLSPDQMNDLDFRISAGPPVILPVALAYKIFVVKVASGRLVAGAYLAFLFLALFLGPAPFGPAAGLLAMALALVGTDVLYWGRSVLGTSRPWASFSAAAGFCSRPWMAVSPPLVWGGIFLGLAFDARRFYGWPFCRPCFW
jgi:hypothetical protein